MLRSVSEVPGLRFPVLATWQPLRVMNTAPCHLIWESCNHCNFGLCCQQPQRAPQAMMETLLAVAVHHSNGRVGTVSPPLPNTHSPLSLCWVPPSCWHKPAALALSTFVGIPWLRLSWSCLSLSCKFLFSLLSPPFPSYLRVQPSDPSWELPQVPPTQQDQGGSLTLMSAGPCMWWHVEGCPRWDLPVLCRNLAAGVVGSS